MVTDQWSPSTKTWLKVAGGTVAADVATGRDGDVLLLQIATVVTGDTGLLFRESKADGRLYTSVGAAHHQNPEARSTVALTVTVGGRASDCYRQYADTVCVAWALSVDGRKVLVSSGGVQKEIWRPGSWSDVQFAQQAAEDHKRVGYAYNERKSRKESSDAFWRGINAGIANIGNTMREHQAQKSFMTSTPLPTRTFTPRAAMPSGYGASMGGSSYRPSTAATPEQLRQRAQVDAVATGGGGGDGSAAKPYARTHQQLDRDRAASATAPRPTGGSGATGAVIVRDDRAEFRRKAEERRAREADLAAQAAKQKALDDENARRQAESEAKARNHKPTPPRKGSARPE